MGPEKMLVLNFVHLRELDVNNFLSAKAWQVGSENFVFIFNISICQKMWVLKFLVCLEKICDFQYLGPEKMGF